MKLFLSRRLYGPRPWTHLDAFHMQPGWLFLEAAAWTLEVDYRPERVRLLARLSAGALALAAASAVPAMDTNGDGIRDSLFCTVRSLMKG